MKKFYVTTPIYYVNDSAHIGHAYSTLIADVLARYHRVLGYKTFFLTGTDEHGAKIEKVAKAAGKKAKKLCDENSLVFKKTWQSLNISYDNFIRTTAQEHIKAVKRVLENLYQNKFIYKGVYKGLYCAGCEQYKTENDLVDGECPDHKIKPELIQEQSYLFRLSKFTNVLEKKIKKDELKISPEARKNEVLRFLKEGLQDISISREKVKWGIPLPFNKQLTCFVWVDAFLNYLTGLGWNGDPKIIPDFWPPNLQIMSKDIVRVHATIWPALLLALNIPLPKQIFSHGYFTVEGQKMSKSLGNVISPQDLIAKFGVDSSRYLLISSLSYGQDGDMSWERLAEKYNADLAAGLGNLVARVITMAKRYKLETLNPKQVKNPKLKTVLNSAWRSYYKTLRDFKFKEALGAVWGMISFCDSYIEKQRPWENNNDNKSKLKNKKVVYELLFALGQIAKMLTPFMPETSEKISKQIKSKKPKPLFPRLKNR